MVSPGVNVSIRVMHMRRGSPVDLGAARAALARLAVPPAREIAGLGGLERVDDVEDDHALLGLHPVVLERAALGVAAPDPHRDFGGDGHHFLSTRSCLSSSGISGLSLLTEFPQLYGVEGWVMEPMPTFGLHLALYATFAGAIVVAVAAHGARRGETGC